MRYGVIEPYPSGIGLTISKPSFLDECPVREV
jgi:hypothetical protein